MTATGTDPFDETVRPEVDRAEDALTEASEDEDAASTEDPSLPVEADEADVLEQRQQVPDDEDELREG